MVTVRRPSDLLAPRLVLQPYGFWHQPWVRAGAIALGLTLGVLAASYLLLPRDDGGGETVVQVRVENEALKLRLETAAREMENARLARVELERQVDALSREVRKLRDELAGAQQKAQKRKRRSEEDEAARAEPPPAGAPAAGAPEQ